MQASTEDDELATKDTIRKTSDYNCYEVNLYIYN